MKQRKRQRYYLVSEARAGELDDFCSEVLDAIREACKRYNVELHISDQACGLLEVYDPTTVLPDGYEYVASFYNGKHGIDSYEVEELLPEDRPKAKAGRPASDVD